MNYRLALEESFLFGLTLREVILVSVLLLIVIGSMTLTNKLIHWLALRLRISTHDLLPIQVGIRILTAVIAATLLAGYFFQINLITALGGVLGLIAIGFV